MKTCPACVRACARRVQQLQRLRLLPQQRCIPGPSQAVGARSISTVPLRHPESIPFSVPPFRSTPPLSYGEKGKGKAASGRRGGPEIDPEQEVDDREWEVRVARAMLHIRETLPHLFESELGSAELFPPDIYSRNVVLKLPAPLPLKVSSLAGYSMAYTLARSGMSAFHSDLHASLDRLTFSPSPAAAGAPAASFFTRRVPAYRHKQIRVLLSISGLPRLPPHKENTWHTSSLYTFSPYSGLISEHEVETIRPLPGEGVADWLMSRLLGWTGRHGQWEGSGGIPIPNRAVVVPRHFKCGSKGDGDR